MLRCVNPLRRFMVWNREVREGTATFKAFRTAMIDLVAEVRTHESPNNHVYGYYSWKATTHCCRWPGRCSAAQTARSLAREPAAHARAPATS